MKKFVNWFIKDSNSKWGMLFITLVIILTLVHQQYLATAFFGCVFFVGCIGIATHWKQLRKLEKEGKIKL